MDRERHSTSLGNKLEPYIVGILWWKVNEFVDRNSHSGVEFAWRTRTYINRVMQGKLLAVDITVIL